ncbi:hypothetical protein [Paenibacillus sp. Y412MC10]|uniref:hypothetical protein n=1 Tax=Geobacillus sp. (strain Y412MC10) TaxID=481743 RepID=UPI00119E54BD|nr:hypothetical protein [Paenibacillus sp. Y412MC10]
MKILNVGCGDDILSCADNTDVKPGTGVIVVDAGNLMSLYPKDSVDVIIMKSPRHFPFEGSDAKEVLKPGGLLVIIGNYSNPFFKSVWPCKDKNSLKVNLEVLLTYTENGFQYVSHDQPPNHPALQTSKTSNGSEIEPSTLKQLVLRKV